MRHLALLFLILSFSACKTSSLTDSNSESGVLFYGADNQSADMSFRSFVYIEVPDGVPPADVVAGANLRIVERVVDYQIQHMFGAFTTHSAFADSPGIALNAGSKIYNGQPTVVIDTENIIGVQNNKYARVFYTYTDKVVFKKNLLENGPAEISFRLPKDPQNIYRNSLMLTEKAIGMFETMSESNDLSWELKDLLHLDEEGEEYANLCTDLHYNSEGDFWYFWNPDQPGCPISAEQLVTVKAKLIPIASTKRTYPYYDLMYGDNGNGNKFEITYLVGIDESYKMGDLGRATFEEAALMLEELGFKNEVDALGKRQRRYQLERDGIDYRINMELVDPNTDVFVKKAKFGLESADVFIYDGHSGLGGYLYVDRFEEQLGKALKLSPQKKQIFYFNGCSTYSYYNTEYFQLKGGSNALDVMTTSVGALFSIGARHDVKLIEHMTSGNRPTWQKIMDDIYKVSPQETALTHVNGDEDNPRKKVAL